MLTDDSVDEKIDLSDLDLLDDQHRHARCTYCQPTVGVLDPFEALCGKRAVRRGDTGPPWRTPENACGECVALFYQPCRRCGQ